MVEMTDVLPAPFGPMMPHRSPSATVKVTFLKSSVAPKETPMLESERRVTERRAGQADKPYLIAALVATEVGPVAIVHQREDGSRHRDARLACIPGIRPRLPKDADLAGLLDVKGLTRFVLLERRALQVHPVLCRPDRRRIRRGAPPDTIAQSR